MTEPTRTGESAAVDAFDLAEALDVIDALLDYSCAHTGHEREGEAEVWDRASDLLRRHRRPR